MITFWVFLTFIIMMGATFAFSRYIEMSKEELIELKEKQKNNPLFYHLLIYPYRLAMFYKK